MNFLCWFFAVQSLACSVFEVFLSLFIFDVETNFMTRKLYVKVLSGKQILAKPNNIHDILITYFDEGMHKPTAR